MPTTININGPIIDDGQAFFYNWLHQPYASQQSVAEQLPTDGSDIDVIINSRGGLIDAGSAIYTALMNYPGQVSVSIVGMAASAASIIAMAGDKVIMSPTAQMMIHNAQNSAAGDANVHRAAAEVLDEFSTGLASAYIKKTGMSLDEVAEMMSKSTFMNADTAKKLGFVDEIMFEEDDELVLINSIDSSGMVPDDIINSMRDQIMSNQTNGTNNPSDIVQTIRVDTADMTGLLDGFKNELDGYEERFNAIFKKIENKMPNEQPTKTSRPFVF